MTAHRITSTPKDRVRSTPSRFLFQPRTKPRPLRDFPRSASIRNWTLGSLSHSVCEAARSPATVGFDASYGNIISNIITAIEINGAGPRDEARPPHHAFLAFGATTEIWVPAQHRDGGGR